MQDCIMFLSILSRGVELITFLENLEQLNLKTNLLATLNVSTYFRCPYDLVFRKLTCSILY